MEIGRDLQNREGSDAWLEGGGSSFLFLLNIGITCLQGEWGRGRGCLLADRGGNFRGMWLMTYGLAGGQEGVLENEKKKIQLVFMMVGEG